jgi:hypothetical protein
MFVLENTIAQQATRCVFEEAVPGGFQAIQ